MRTTITMEARPLSRIRANRAGSCRRCRPPTRCTAPSTPEFIDAVAPRIGVLSVGYRNRFRHPNSAVVERYVERSIELRRTDAEGALHLELPGRAPALPRVESQAFKMRYWSERRRDSWTPK